MKNTDSNSIRSHLSGPVSDYRFSSGKAKRSGQATHVDPSERMLAQ